MTIELHPATDYQACVDPLHRNTWPVRVAGSDAVIGYLTEHITVTLDLPQPPETRWSWAFSDAEATELRVDEDLRASRGRYLSWRHALRAFTVVHQAAVSARGGQ